MRLFRDYVNRQMSFEDTLKKNNKNQFSYEVHVSIYLFCLAYLDKYDPLLGKKRKIYKSFLNAIGDNKIKYYQKLIEFKKKEDEVIFEALTKFEDEIAQKGQGLGSLYQPMTLGVSAFEFQAHK